MIDATAALRDILIEEQSALGRSSAADLQDITDRKLAQCETLDALARRIGPLAPRIENLADPDAAALAELHDSFKNLAAETKDYNLVNGKVIHHAQQSVQELSRLLGGADADGIYGRQGQREPVATGAPIADA